MLQCDGIFTPLCHLVAWWPITMECIELSRKLCRVLSSIYRLKTHRLTTRVDSVEYQASGTCDS
jgi:hypothetical protein